MESRLSGRALARRGFAFEDLVADLFERLGYSVTRESLGGMEIDLVLRRNGSVIPVEVSTRSTMAKLSADAERLRSLKDTVKGLSTPIVVVGSNLTSQAKEWCQSQYNVYIWDLQELVNQAARFPEISKRLQSFLLETPKPGSTVDSELDTLRQRVRDHLEGNSLSSAEYEALCIAVFVKLFDPHLYGFQRQAETTDGGNRYDFICRIRPGNTFWDGLRQDFRTKAILFECKNYAEPIGPDQVYSTERYLFSGALRTVCILIARLGASDAAIRAAQGAMRESGKLLILLSNQDLIEMLTLRTQEGGPEDFLDKRIWDFIISLPR